MCSTWKRTGQRRRCPVLHRRINLLRNGARSAPPSKRRRHSDPEAPRGLRVAPLITSRSFLQDDCVGRIDGPSNSLSSNDSQNVRASSQATGLRKEGDRRARFYVARARTMTRTLFRWGVINRNDLTRDSVAFCTSTRNQKR